MNMYLEYLHKSLGIEAEAAKRMKISPSTVSKWKNRFPEFSRAVIEIKETQRERREKYEAEKRRKLRRAYWR